MRVDTKGNGGLPPLGQALGRHRRSVSDCPPPYFLDPCITLSTSSERAYESAREGSDAADTPKSTLAPTLLSSSPASPVDTPLASPSVASGKSHPRSAHLRMLRLARGSFSTLSYVYAGGAALSRMPLLLRPHASASYGSTTDSAAPCIEMAGDREEGGEGEGESSPLSLKREKRTGEASEIASSWAPVPGTFFFQASSDPGRPAAWQEPAALHQLFRAETREQDSLCDYFIADDEHRTFDDLHHPSFSSTHLHLHPDPEDDPPGSPRLPHAHPDTHRWAMPPPVADEEGIRYVWERVTLEKEERMRQEAAEWEDGMYEGGIGGA